jgi:S-DNA-T family DNA segregation ATPase FtsK/SpoIIIE
MRARGRKEKPPTGGAGSPPTLLILLWLVLAAGWALATASIASFTAADPPSHAVFPTNDPVHNWCGPAGAWLAYRGVRLLGLGVWVVLGASGACLVATALGRRVTQPFVRALGVVLLAAGVSAGQALALPERSRLPGLAGGTLGQFLTGELQVRFATLGAALWIAAGTVIGAVVAIDRGVFALPVRAARAAAPAAMRAFSAAGRSGSTAARASSGLAGRILALLRIRRRAPVRLDDIEDDPDLPRHRARAGSNAQAGDVDEGDVDEGDVDEGSGEDIEERSHLDEAALREKIARLPIVFAGQNKRVATDEDLRDLQGVQELEGYRFPGLELLADPEENFTQRLEGLVREQARALEAALREYRIDGEVAGIESGPVITLYHLRLAPGTKVALLHAIASDVARALRAVNIRIVSNMAGRDTVGIEVPNPTKEKVRLKELMSDRERFAKMRLPMFLGKDASGEPLIEDLAEMPHMLIAGTTGSGKSVCINTIIMGFLYAQKPNHLKLVLVDPKMVELSQFRDIPHLMCPVVTEMPRAAAILEWACRKMDERYELLAEAGCRDIASYNETPWEELRERFRPQSPEEEARIPRRLPYMVFIIDELADLMMTTREVEGAIIRVAQKARAVGIHLILATQRPQANVVTGLIKSNMPCRVTFKVASGMDSRIVLDQKGGELLLGQGDMLLLSPRSHKLVRAQGTLVDDHEIRRVVRFMRDVAAPTFERQLLQLRAAGPDEERLLESENNSSASLAAAQEDPLFDRAVEIVLESERGSVSLLQRRLAIGYTRASRLIDLMGIAGIISDHKGSVARDVLITPQEWEAMKRLAAEHPRSAPPPDAGADAGSAPLPDDDAGDEPATSGDHLAETPRA